MLEEAHDKIAEIERKPIKFWMTASQERHEYTFDPQDGIFFMSGPNKKGGNKTTKCQSCFVITLKSDSNNFCEFCGHNVCKDCF